MMEVERAKEEEDVVVVVANEVKEKAIKVMPTMKIKTINPLEVVKEEEETIIDQIKEGMISLKLSVIIVTNMAIILRSVVVLPMKKRKK